MSIDECLAIPADPALLLERIQAFRAESGRRRRGFAGMAFQVFTRRIAPGIAALLLLLVSSGSFAWGPDGHRITGEIAWRSLSPKTKAAVSELLPEGRYDTLAEAAAWADTYARNHPREYRWLDPFHFVDADPRAEHVVADRRCGCVVAGIENNADRLRDPKTSRDSKIEALRLVAHFVGDVHQPLHVSHPDMRGGTTIDVRFAGEPMTLHRLWDSALLERRLRERRRGRSPRWRGFAQSLADSVDAARRVRWTASLDPHSWADESLALAKQPVFAVRKTASLNGAYYEDSMPVVEQRLEQAGIRLAALLNAIFDPAERLQ